MNDKIGVTITKKTQQQVTWELLKTLAELRGYKDAEFEMAELLENE